MDLCVGWGVEQYQRDELDEILEKLQTAFEPPPPPPYDQIWSNITKYYQIWPNIVKLDQIYDQHLWTLSILVVGLVTLFVSNYKVG